MLAVEPEGVVLDDVAGVVVEPLFVFEECWEVLALDVAVLASENEVSPPLVDPFAGVEVQPKPMSALRPATSKPRRMVSRAEFGSGEGGMEIGTVAAPSTPLRSPFAERRLPRGMMRWTDSVASAPHLPSAEA